MKTLNLSLLFTTRTTVLVVTCLLSMAVVLPGTSLAANGCSGNTQPPDLALQLTSPDGNAYIDLLGPSDGPVRISVESRFASALQISTRFQEDDALAVFIHAVVDDFTIESIGSYELPLSAEARLIMKLSLSGALETGGDFLVPAKLPALATPAAVELHELEVLDLEGWTMRIAVLPTLRNKQAGCGCCGCGGLRCCPDLGKCIDPCGDCGGCCCIE